MGKVTVTHDNKIKFDPIKITIEIELNTLHDYSKLREDIMDYDEEWEFPSHIMQTVMKELKNKIR